MLPITLVIVYGLPGAGKSSLCNSLLRMNLGSTFSFCPNVGAYNERSIPMNSKASNTLAQQLATVTIEDNGSKEASSNVPLNNGFNGCSRYVHVCFDSLITYKDQERYVTVAKNRQEIFQPSNSGVQIRSSTESDPTASWKKAREEVLSKVEQFLCQVRQCEQNGSSLNDLISSCEFTSNTLTSDNILPISLVILLDDNFYYRSMRQPYYALAGVYEAGFCEVLVKCSIEEALERNSRRCEGTEVPSDVIERMALKMENAAPLSHSWEQHSLEILSSDGKENLNQLAVLQLIQTSSTLPVILSETEKALELRATAATESRSVCSRSVLHQADLLLRQFVAETIKNDLVDDFDVRVSRTPSSVEDLVKNANSVRHMMLKEMKAGSLRLPQCLSEEFTPEMKPLLSNALRAIFRQKISNS